MANFLVRSWRGQESPRRVFWWLFGIGSIVVFGIIFGIFWLLIPNLTDTAVLMNYIDLMNVLTLPYMIFCTIAIWRCAEHGSNRAYIIKGIMVLSILSCIGSLISLFVK